MQVWLYCLPRTVTADNISKYQYVSVRPKAILWTQTDVVKNLPGVVAHQPWVGVLPTVSASLSSHLRSSSHVLDGLRSTRRCLALHGRREHHGRRWRRPGQRRRYGRTTHHLHPLTNYQHSIRILKYTQHCSVKEMRPLKHAIYKQRSFNPINSRIAQTFIMDHQ